jgi:DNA-binding SARP family transcriptional activator
MTGHGDVGPDATLGTTGGVRLRLFGGFRLEDENGRPIPVSLRKAEALLAYLAVSAGQSAPRETLAALLWGDFAQPRARQSLRQVLLALGKTLRRCETPVLRVTDQTVSLAPGAVLVDALELARLTDEGSSRSLASAASLCGGEFLAGLRLDAPEFEDWLAVTRGRQRDLALRALAALLKHQESVDDLESAAATARRILAIDPFREDIHRRLMRLYAENGMRASALAQYRECREVLNRELGVLPDLETTRLYQSIHDQASAGDGPAERQGSVTPRRRADSKAGRLPAEAVEQLQAEALAAHYRVLARRLGEAGRREDALAALVLAARLEMKRGAQLAARRILELGQALLRDADGSGEDSSAALDLYLALAVSAEESDDLDTARSALEAAERLAEGLADSRRRAKVLIARSRAHQRDGEEAAAWDCARRGLSLATGWPGIWPGGRGAAARRACRPRRRGPAPCWLWRGPRRAISSKRTRTVLGPSGSPGSRAVRIAWLPPSRHRAWSDSGAGRPARRWRASRGRSRSPRHGATCCAVMYSAAFAASPCWPVGGAARHAAS